MLDEATPPVAPPRRHVPPVVWVATVAALLIVGGAAVVIAFPMLHGKSSAAAVAAPTIAVTKFASPIAYELAPDVRTANIRAAPSADATPIGALKADEPIEAVGRSADTNGKTWLALTLDGGKIGYVRERLLAGVAPAPTASAAMSSTAGS